LFAGGGVTALSAGERRVCLLAGAAGTLGTDFCRRFADRYDIAAIYRNSRPSVACHDQTAVDPLRPEAELPENRCPVFAVQADLTTEAGCERAVDLTLARFGQIDLLVNAAAAPVWGPMLGNDRLLGTAEYQLTTNVLAPLRLAVVAARRFWQNRDGENRRHNRNVVNLSSVAGLRLYAGSGQSLYAASKAALNHLTAHMAIEFAPVGIRVNAVAPNSFPSLVPTERATDAVVALDEGASTATIVIVDGESDEVIELHPFTAQARPAQLRA